jgi:hypothetical protein
MRNLFFEHSLLINGDVIFRAFLSYLAKKTEQDYHVAEKLMTKAFLSLDIEK